MSTPEDVAALWDKERAPWELEPHFSEAMLLLTSKAVFAKSEVATVIANHRATIEAQEEAGRLANISTARAVERAEKAEAVVERLERERDGYASNFRDAWAAINRLREEVETRSGGMVAPEHTGPEFGHEAEQIARGVIAIYDRAIAAEAEVERLPEESTAEMKLAGARSIANSMHYENHGSRAELCWRHMVANFRTGAMPPVPKAGPRNLASAKTAEDR